MIKSMTGYGKAEAAAQHRKITVEIRSLNSKQLDMSVRIPQVYRPLEYEVRNRIGKAVQRGKVDVYINVETDTAAIPVTINRELFMNYYSVLKGISDQMEEQGRGIGKIETLRKAVEPFEARRVNLIKERIRENIASVGVQVDENRLEQEMIFYVEKLDVTEEKVRLDNHCRYFREVAAQEENAGRKLGFIAQEMGREINTLGSKANDSDMQKTVVMMKDELEKIKEQVLNIL